MTNTKPLDKQKLEDLEATYEALVRDRFLPTLKEYSGMAAEALALQVAIYKKRLGKLYKLREMPRVITFSARSSLADFNGLLVELDKMAIKVTEIIYDPARQEFFIYAAV